jgi:uncharacterized membrane protein
MSHSYRLGPKAGLDTPLAGHQRVRPAFSPDPEVFGSATEGFARFMGTPRFLVYMTIFCVFWLGWNTWAPLQWRFDSQDLGFTLLTLILSLQASYAAPLLLLAQNRQDDRDRISLQQDRQRAERNLSETEYLTRELASLRIGLRQAATRDYVRAELRILLNDILQAEAEGPTGGPNPPPPAPVPGGTQQETARRRTPPTP